MRELVDPFVGTGVTEGLPAALHERASASGFAHFQQTRGCSSASRAGTQDRLLTSVPA